MSTPRQILAAIFDMDGLIFNTERQFFKFESMVHKKYGYPSRIEDFTQTLGLSFASVKEVHKKIFGEDFLPNRYLRKLVNQLQMMLKKTVWKL